MSREDAAAAVAATGLRLGVNVIGLFEAEMDDEEEKELERLRSKLLPNRFDAMVYRLGQKVMPACALTKFDFINNYMQMIK